MMYSCVVIVKFYSRYLIQIDTDSYTILGETKYRLPSPKCGTSAEGDQFELVQFVSDSYINRRDRVSATAPSLFGGGNCCAVSTTVTIKCIV